MSYFPQRCSVGATVTLGDQASRIVRPEADRQGRLSQVIKHNSSFDDRDLFPDRYHVDAAERND